MDGSCWINCWNLLHGCHTGAHCHSGRCRFNTYTFFSRLVNSLINKKISIYILVYLSKKIPDIRMQVAVKTDNRIRLMNDVISGIQTVKMYTWEESFANIVKQARR
jgi:hypothetical protein